MKESTLARGITTLAVCALALAELASAKNPVTRPFKINGHVEATVTGVSGSLVSLAGTDVGEATHGGRYFNQGTEVVDLSTGQFTGSGVATVANGDTLNWVVVSGPGANQFTVTWTGGTGRFANVSGGYIGTQSNVVLTPTTESFDYTGEGTITY